MALTLTGQVIPVKCDKCGKNATSYKRLWYPADTVEAGCDDHPVPDVWRADG